jgi:hypothetical protein
MVSARMLTAGTGARAERIEDAVWQEESGAAVGGIRALRKGGLTVGRRVRAPELGRQR